MDKTKRKRNLFIIGSLLLALTVVVIFSVSIGQADVSFMKAANIIGSKIPFLKSISDISDVKESQETIILKIRLPRIILAALIGMALAAVGTTFQGLLKNPMADPYIIGVSSGSALGAALAIVSGISLTFGYFMVPLSAFAGALVSIFTVYNIARVGNKIPVYNLLLSGVALSSFLSALTSLLMILNSKETSQILYWMLGSFSGKTWEHVRIALPLIALGIISLYFFTRELNLLLFGEATAQNLGVNVEKTKKILLILGSFTVASAVAVSGTIGFVGLIVPHAVRLVTGSDHRILLPAASLAGGVFMVFADTIARTILSPAEIPVGIITALFGGPFFIYLLKSKKTIA